MAYPNPNSAPYSNTLALALTPLTLTRCVAYEYSGYVDDEYVRVSSGGCHHDPCETADSRGCFYGWDVTQGHDDEDEEGEDDDDDDDKDGEGDDDSSVGVEVGVEVGIEVWVGGDGDGEDDDAFGTAAKKEGKDKDTKDKEKTKDKTKDHDHDHDHVHKGSGKGKSKGKDKGGSNVLANGYCCRGALCNLKPVEEICGAAAPVALLEPQP